jgi:spoIIIJ-associated protein
LVSEVRQEGYAGPVSEDASDLGAKDSAPGPDGSRPAENLDPTQGPQDAGSEGVAGDNLQDSGPEVVGPEDPGPEAGAGLVPDETAGQDVESMDGADRGSSGDAAAELGGVRSEADREAGTVGAAETAENAEVVTDAEAEADDDADDSDADDEDNPLDTEAEIAADYLEELLDIADLDGDIDTYIEGDRAHVSIVSESEILVGPNGEVLDALQELARLAVMSETGGRSRLMLDIAGYRERRRKELIVIANDAVQEARETNQRVPLAPMNPFERKIVHDAVVLAGLTSASEGEEPKRHVVIHPVP